MMVAATVVLGSNSDPPRRVGYLALNVVALHYNPDTGYEMAEHEESVQCGSSHVSHQGGLQYCKKSFPIFG